jgi:hypothetical protein
VWGSEEEDSEEQEDGIVPIPVQDLVNVGAMVVGTGAHGFQDGAAAGARGGSIFGLLQLPDCPTSVCWWRTSTTNASVC